MSDLNPTTQNLIVSSNSNFSPFLQMQEKFSLGSTNQNLVNKSRSSSKSPSPSNIQVVMVGEGTPKFVKMKNGKPFCIVQPGTVV